MEPIQTLPEVKDMATSNYTAKNWLQFYLNVWTRYLVSRIVDVETDIALKAEDPNQEVTHSSPESGQVVMPVSQRLEFRKILVKDTLNTLNAIKKLNDLSDEDFAKTYSDEYLAVAPDMVATPGEKKEYKVTNDAGIELSDGTKIPGNSVVKLDPSTDETQHFISSGFIQEVNTSTQTTEAKI